MGISQEILVQIMQTTLTTIFFFTLHTGIANAQVDSAQWVMRAYVEATGGAALWDSTWSISYKATDISANGGYTGNRTDETALMHKTLLRSGEALIKQIAMDEGKANVSYHCLRDNHYYLHSVKNGDTSNLQAFKDPATLQKVKTAFGHFATQHFVLDQDSIARNAEYGGIYKQGENTYYLIYFHSEGGQTIWYVNCETLLIDRREKSTSSYTLLSDYQYFQGRYMPTKRSVYQNNKLISEVLTKSASFNVPLPDCPFSHTAED